MSEVAVLSRPPMDKSAAGTVLIIDDEHAIRESLETLLEFEGYSVVSAETGEEGLAKIAETPFDLILLDFALPDRNGLEILADIRSRDPQLAVIMITAYGTVDNAVRAMQSGATNFIQKLRFLFLIANQSKLLNDYYLMLLIELLQRVVWFSIILSKVNERCFYRQQNLKQKPWCLP